MTAIRIATADSCDFWQINGEVYRAPKGTGLDTVGHPMGKRWECSRGHWDLYRTSAFSWAIDVPPSTTGKETR